MGLPSWVEELTWQGRPFSFLRQRPIHYQACGIPIPLPAFFQVNKSWEIAEKLID